MQASSDQAKGTQTCKEKTKGGFGHPLNGTGSQEKILNIRNVCYMERAVRKDIS